MRFDLDLKVAGREDEVVAALRERGLMDRAMTSTMEVSSVAYLRDAAPELYRGWTIPKVSRDYSRGVLLRPVFLAGSAVLRARLPGHRRAGAPELGVWAIWAYHRADHAAAGRGRALGRTSGCSPGRSTTRSGSPSWPSSASTGSARTTRGLLNRPSS